MKKNYLMKLPYQQTVLLFEIKYFREKLGLKLMIVEPELKRLKS